MKKYMRNILTIFTALCFVSVSFTVAPPKVRAKTFMDLVYSEERVKPGDMLALEDFDNGSAGFSDFDTGYYANVTVASGKEIPVERLDVIFYGDRWMTGGYGVVLTLDGGAAYRGVETHYKDGVYISFPIDRKITGKYELYISISEVAGSIRSAIAVLTNGSGYISASQGSEDVMSLGHALDSAYIVNSPKDSVLNNVAVLGGEFILKVNPWASPDRRLPEAESDTEDGDTEYSDTEDGDEEEGDTAAERDTAASITMSYPLLQAPLLTMRAYDNTASGYRPVTLMDDEGNIHYFCESGDNIIIRVFDQNLTTLRSITIPKPMPIFGTAAIDGDGNYYISFGKSISDEKNKSEKNVMVAKYSKEGRLAGSAAFVGGEGYLYGTKTPLYNLPGMAISENLLALHFSRLMFQSGDGLNHQSSTVLYVDIDTMNPVKAPTHYVSHSFDQTVIATRDGGFLFADRGDGYPRGFVVSKMIWGRMFSFTPFHFRELNPYQSTNSLLGGIAENDHGYLLAGTSDRILSNTAIPASNGGPQDLFIQIIDKDFFARRNDKDKVISNGVTRRTEGIQHDTGLNRSGGQSYFLPAEVEDHGVIWLTSYPEGESAVNPKLTAQEDGFVLMWEHWGKGANTWQSYMDTWYMMLGADGSVQKAATKISSNPRLYSGSSIFYDEGKVYWTAGEYDKITLYAMAIYDRPSAWAIDQVNKAIREGIIPSGIQSKYTQTATRAEYCALAVTLYEKFTGEEIAGRKTFDDTDDVNVEKMAAVGVVTGIGGNRFAPDAPLTREQAAAMLSRLAAAMDKPLPEQDPDYADNDKIASWAFEGVGSAQAAGIMTGVGNNTFAPGSPYTREQSIITMLRVWNYLTILT